MPRDRSSTVALLSCALAGALVMGSTLTVSAARPDAVAALGQPTVRGERAGKRTGGGRPDTACARYPVGAANRALDLIVVDGLVSKPLADHVAALCFAVDTAAMDREFHDPKTGTRLATWIQPEMRMHQTDPTLLAANAGMIVAKVRNERPNGQPARLPKWARPLAHRTDALLWYGRRGGQPYAVLFELNGNRVNVISSGRWVKENPLSTNHAFAMADWDRHRRRTGAAPVPGTLRLASHASHASRPTAMQLQLEDGSGWISCKLGCCTAMELNVDPPLLTDPGAAALSARPTRPTRVATGS